MGLLSDILEGVANLGMIGGVKPGGGYWQGLDSKGTAHAANPDYRDYSQLFREYTFDQKPGYFEVGRRGDRPVFAAPDYMRGEDRNYMPVSAADAARIAQERGLLVPTRDEVKGLYGQAHHVPMPTQPIWKTGGQGDAVAYTEALQGLLADAPEGKPIVHGKEFYRVGGLPDDWTYNLPERGPNPLTNMPEEVLAPREPYQPGKVDPNEAIQLLEATQYGPRRDLAPEPPRNGIPESLIRTESGGNFGASNNVNRGHYGRLQFNPDWIARAAREGVIPEMTPEQFRSNPDAQMALEDWYAGEIWGFIDGNGLDRYVGQEINGVPVTRSGMFAAAHLGGMEGLRKHLESGGQYNPSDAYGTSLSDYMATHADAGLVSPYGGNEVIMASNNPNQAIADDAMRAIGRQPIRASSMSAPQAQQAPGREERSLLGGWLTPDRRDRLIMALQGMTLNPNQALIQAASDRISTREGQRTDRQKRNRTVEALRRMGASDAAIELAQADPTAAMRLAIGERQAATDPNVQSSQMLPDMSGTVMTMRDGSVKVMTAGGETLTGQAAMDFVRNSNENYTGQQRSIYSAREEGKLSTRADIGEQAAAADSLGGKRGDMVEGAFEQADQAASSIRNIQQAINAIDDGAKAGVVYNMLPNVTKASADLQNALDKMGLDVIGSVTFGALSEGELRLAMETAAPRNLGPQELRKWLVEKLQAQQKVRVALMEQARFLSDPNNTLEDWAEMVGGGNTGSPSQQNTDDPLGLR